MTFSHFVIPAKVGIHAATSPNAEKGIPAFAGMTSQCFIRSRTNG